MLLGALTKGMATISVLSLRPEVPFDGQTFYGCTLIKAIVSPEWYHKYNESHECSLVTTVKMMVDAVMSSTEGLGLQVKGSGIDKRMGTEENPNRVPVIVTKAKISEV
jgi:hypothetical protein